MSEKGPMDQFTAHLDRGWDLVTRGDLSGARVSAQKSLEIDNDSPEAHNLMGFIQAAEGDSEEALDHYKRALELDETFVEAMLNAAELLIHPLHNLEEALALCDEAIELAMDDDEIADALLIKIDGLLHFGDREAAKRVVAVLPEGPFQNPQLDFLIGRAKFEVGDLDGAEPKIRSAATRDPFNAEVQYYLALVYEARSDSRGATVAFLRTRELDLEAPRPPWAVPVDQFEKRVKSAILKLPEEFSKYIDGALCVVSDLPGAEVVAEGIDPRIGVLLDDIRPKEGEPMGAYEHKRAFRVFVYQRNIERMSSGVAELEDEIVATLLREMGNAFPELAPAAERHLSALDHEESSASGEKEARASDAREDEESAEVISSSDDEDENDKPRH